MLVQVLAGAYSIFHGVHVHIPVCHGVHTS